MHWDSLTSILAYAVFLFGLRDFVKIFTDCRRRRSRRRRMEETRNGDGACSSTPS